MLSPEGLPRRLIMTMLHVAQSMGRPNAPRRVRVQGVELWMPRSHTLPLFTSIYPGYGQNLVLIAKLLSREAADASLSIIDVGANIGDSAKQLSSAVRCKVLCIEGDPKWLPYLRRNSRGMEWDVEPAFVDVGKASESEIVHVGGTTRLMPGRRDVGDVRLLSMADILERHPAYKAARLLKTDTDGYDCEIIRQVLTAGLLSDDAVLFFEYDPVLTRDTNNAPAISIWPLLHQAGYESILVWDNFGNYLGSHKSAEMELMARGLEQQTESGVGRYWDVAALKPKFGSLADELEKRNGEVRR